MTYEKTPINKQVTSQTAKKVLLKQVDQLGTATLVWFLVKRHKMAIVSAWAAGVTLMYFFPFLPDLLISLM